MFQTLPKSKRTISFIQSMGGEGLEESGFCLDPSGTAVVWLNCVWDEVTRKQLVEDEFWSFGTSASSDHQISECGAAFHISLRW